MSSLQEYLGKYEGKELLKKYSIHYEGLWEVLGEDPNCDLGGYHSNPSLGFYTGKLGDVLEMAVGLPGFWQWGAGGTICLITPKTIEQGKQKAELLKEKRKLEERISQIDKELK